MTLANAHGLHARPAKILAQLAKGFDGDIRVRIVDGTENPVSAKSLSKLLSLGVQRGQVPGVDRRADALPPTPCLH